MSRNTTRRARRHAHVDNMTHTYAALRRAGTPSFVTSHEAYHMTDARVGVKGDHSLDHGFGLATLIKKAGGAVKALSDLNLCADGDHDAVLPVPGLPGVSACMDCGASFVEDDQTAAEAPAAVEAPHTVLQRGAVVKYLSAVKKAGSAQWRVRNVDPDGTLTLDLLGHSKRSTARFGVDPARVVVVQGAPETY